jgi:hypothetical protein
MKTSKNEEALPFHLLDRNVSKKSYQGSFLLGPFTKLRKAIISYLTLFRMEQICCDWTDFHEILCIFRKYVPKS